MHILVNGVNAASAGGRGVLLGLIPPLASVGGEHVVTALVPPNSFSPDGLPKNLRIIEQPRSGPRQVWRLMDDLIRLPGLVRRIRPDVFFSISDLGPGDVGCPHVMLLHNPWVTYQLPRRRIGCSLRDQLVYASYYPARFRRLWPRLARLIVQTPVMADRVVARYGVPRERIDVIPPGCLLTPGQRAPRRTPVSAASPLRLFWPARGYPHKNHDILAPLCRELAREGLADRVRFFVTLDPEAGSRVTSLLETLRPYADIVTNLGTLAREQVERWFDDTDGLFLPTLLESYSLTYLEASTRHRPVLTSDRDFARFVCGTAGYYFDPDDPGSICTRIAELIGDIEAGTLRIPEPPGVGQTGISWESVAARVLDVLRGAASAGRGAARGTAHSAIVSAPPLGASL